MRTVTSAILAALGGVSVIVLSGCPGTRQPPLKSSTSTAQPSPTVDDTGVLYVFDGGARATTRSAVVAFQAPFGATSTASVTFGGSAVGPVSAVAVEDGGRVVLASRDIDQVSIFEAPLVAGESSTVTLTNDIRTPVGLGFDGSGTLWVVNATATALFAPPFVSGDVPVQTVPLLTADAGGGIAFLATGTALVSSFDPGTIMAVEPPFTGPATTAMFLQNLGPRGIALDASGALYVAESSASQIAVFEPPFTNENETPAFVIATSAGPRGVTFDPAGNLFVTLGDGTVAIYQPPFTQGMEPAAVVTTGLTSPAGVAIGP